MRREGVIFVGCGPVVGLRLTQWSFIVSFVGRGAILFRGVPSENIHSSIVYGCNEIDGSPCPSPLRIGILVFGLFGFLYGLEQLPLGPHVEYIHTAMGLPCPVCPFVVIGHVPTGEGQL